MDRQLQQRLSAPQMAQQIAQDGDTRASPISPDFSPCGTMKFLHFRAVDSSEICGMRGFSGSHRSDALYQGTTLTLVVP
jgi:hypothetical protein